MWKSIKTEWLIMNTIFYDEKNERLVYVDEAASHEYWDNHWKDELKKTLTNPPRNQFYTALTKKYLKPGSVVLEGGCGKGDKVLALSKAGFNAIGIDFAENTVAEINRVRKDLDVRVGDVRALDLNDSSVDGYWSLGVIEHFYDGYDVIVKEMYRVIKSGGFLFLSFPSISEYRSKLIKQSFYKVWVGDKESDFYQFAFSDKSVIEKLDMVGFDLVETKYTGNLKGLRSHSLFGRLARLLSRVPSPLASIFSRVMDSLFYNRYSHMTLLILKKR